MTRFRFRSLDARRLLSFVLAALLLLAQQGVQLHGLSHAKADLGAAAHLPSAHASVAGACTPADHPARDHGREQCLAFHAADSALAPAVLAAATTQSVQSPAAPLRAGHSSPASAPFGARAPPSYS